MDYRTGNHQRLHAELFWVNGYQPNPTTTEYRVNPNVSAVLGARQSGIRRTLSVLWFWHWLISKHRNTNPTILRLNQRLGLQLSLCQKPKQLSTEEPRGSIHSTGQHPTAEIESVCEWGTGLVSVEWSSESRLHRILQYSFGTEADIPNYTPAERPCDL